MTTRRETGQRRAHRHLPAKRPTGRCGVRQSEDTADRVPSPHLARGGIDRQTANHGAGRFQRRLAGRGLRRAWTRLVTRRFSAHPTNYGERDGDHPVRRDGPDENPTAGRDRLSRSQVGSRRAASGIRDVHRQPLSHHAAPPLGGDRRRTAIRPTSRLVAGWLPDRLRLASRQGVLGGTARPYKRPLA